MARIEIGRRTIYGNPFFARSDERLLGKTLDAYTEWLYHALRGDHAAFAFYQQITGITLPENYAEHIQALEANLARGDTLWCPGCREHTCEPGICHGSILLQAINGTGVFAR